MEISARRGIRIGLKRYALVVDSGVRVAFSEIWFQNPKAAACRTGGKKNAAPFQSTKRCSNAPVVRSLPHRTRRTGEDDQFLIHRERRSQGKIKGRCAALPMAVHNVQFIRRYAGKQRAEISRPCASLLIISPSPPVVNSPLRSEYDHAIMTA